jgi:hypothetical protein
MPGANGSAVPVPTQQWDRKDDCVYLPIHFHWYGQNVVDAIFTFFSLIDSLGQRSKSEQS